MYISDRIWSFEVRNLVAFVGEVVMMGCQWKNGKGNRKNAAVQDLSAPLQ